MPRLLRLGSIACAIVSVVLFGLGIASWQGSRLDASTEGDLRIDADSKSFGESPAGRIFPVEFVLTNRSPTPVRVIGANSLCTPVGCLKADGLPIAIPPRGRYPLKVLVSTRRPGEFTGAITLFTDCPGRPRIAVEVKGRVAGGPAET